MNCNFSGISIEELGKMVEEDTQKYQYVSDSFKDEKKRNMWVHFIINRNIVKLVSKELDFIDDNQELKDNKDTLKYMRETIVVNNKIFDKVIEKRYLEEEDDLNVADTTKDLTNCLEKIYKELNNK